MDTNRYSLSGGALEGGLRRIFTECWLVVSLCHWFLPCLKDGWVLYISSSFLLLSFNHF